jgi:predicted SAM-dependent methyltransferase
VGVIGHLDECGWDLIRGWAWDPADPVVRRVLNVTVDGVCVGSVTAELPAADLAAAGFGDGSYRFRFELQQALSSLQGDIHDVAVIDSATNELIHHVVRLNRLSTTTMQDQDLCNVMAVQVLHGTGIEIGALDNPQPVGPGVSVQYVDRYSTERLRAEYPEIGNALVPVSIVDDGSRLDTVVNDSCDFVIANNLIEHVEDPVAALVRWTDVLRIHGVLFLIVPNRRNSIDSDRMNTSLEHFFESSPSGHRHGHYVEWASVVDGLTGQDAVRRAKQLDDSSYSIHFHVWDDVSFGAFLTAAITRCDLPLELEMLAQQRNRSETLAILRRR